MPQNSRDRLSVPVERSIRQCRLYVDGVQQPGQYAYATALHDLPKRDAGTKAKGNFVWLEVEEPTDAQMEKIAHPFGVNELIVEDAVSAHQRAKLERYDDQLFMVIRSVLYAGDKKLQDSRDLIRTGEVQMVIQKNSILVISHRTHPLDPEPKLNQVPELRTAGPLSIAWAVADTLVDEYTRIAEELGEEVDQLEEAVFDVQQRFDIERIYTLKREILEMRHAINPLVPALRALINDHKDLTTKPVRSFFRDVLDHAILAADTVDAYDERLSSLIDAAAAIVSLRQNTDMRTISAVVGIAAAPTLIAGIYGMNFAHMPELQWRYGYFIALGVMVAVVLLMWWWFKKNDWL